MSNLFVPNLLANDIPSTSSQFILVTDSLLQPGLLLLRQFIGASIARSEHVILVSLEQTPSRLIPSSPFDKVDIIDLVSTLGASYASTSTTTPNVNESILRALYEKQDHRDLTKAILSAVEKAGSKKVLVVLDSVDQLYETAGIRGVSELIKSTLKGISSSNGSRLLALHHHEFPRPTESMTAISTPLLPVLLTPTLSSSTIHLTLHPSLLLELLSREYNLTIPLSPSISSSFDLRLPDFLKSFSSRSYGDPFIRPSSTREEDQRIPLDQLGSSSRRNCVVEWTARGITLGQNILKCTIGGVVNGKVERRVLMRGIEGLIKRNDGSLEGVGLDRVLKSDRMSNAIIRPTASPLSPNVTSTSRPATTISSSEPAPLPFNLNLTPSQESARSSVPLPFVAKEGAAGMYQGGAIEYLPDEGDDMDDDDPDEDLEV